MKKVLSYAVAACVAAGGLTTPAMADSVTVKVKPPAVRVVQRKPCYYKTVKTIAYNKVKIVKKRVCP